VCKLADFDAYLLRKGQHRKNVKAIDNRAMKRLRNRRYYDGYFLELLNLKRSASYSPAPDGTPTWWERKANKHYSCSACRNEISMGERYIGCRKLSPGMRGPYGYKGTYRTKYFHIICILSIEHDNAEKEINQASSEIGGLQNQIASLKDTSSQRKKQIKYCEIAKEKAKKEYDDSNSLRKLVKWIGYKYTFWSKNGEIQGFLREIISIENEEIPMRENSITELLGRISSLKSWQKRLKMESREFLGE
jgi:hypothetical protein